MSQANEHSHDGQQDIVESIVPYIPVVIPIVGGVLILMLAFIAVFMAEARCLHTFQTLMPESRKVDSIKYPLHTLIAQG